MLDHAGFPEVRILASNEIDETVVDSIRDEGGRVDIYGVGTKLATASGVGGVALGGVYKLVAIDGQAKMKITSDLARPPSPASSRSCAQSGPRVNFSRIWSALTGKRSKRRQGL
jgi:nicotinate phosphoribosyltransferase